MSSTSKTERSHDSTSNPALSYPPSPINKEILSVQIAVPSTTDEKRAVEAARYVNDAYADIVRRYPGHFAACRSRGMKKVSGLSVGAIGFAIFVIALDFAVIRVACLSPRPEERAGPGAPLLPGMLAGRLLSRGPDGWAVFAFFLLPMIDALLIGVYRLRRRGDRTAGTAGSVIAGSVATLAVFTACLIAPGTAIGLSMPISRRIALASFNGLARLLGVAVSPNHPMAWTNLAVEWIYVVIFALLIPIAFFCIPPLLVAVLAGRVARNFGPSRPTMGAGSGETTRGVEAPDRAIQRTRRAGR
jgi:hypothetical protein